MTLQEKLDLVTNYFADAWAIDKAMSLLEDYEKMLEAQQTAPSAAAAEIVELLECSGCLKVGQKDRALAIVARLLPAQHGGVL